MVLLNKLQMWTLFKCINLVTFFPCSLKERLNKIFFKIHKGLEKNFKLNPDKSLPSIWNLICILEYVHKGSFWNISHIILNAQTIIGLKGFFIKKIEDKGEFLKSYLNFSHLIKIPYIDILHWRHQEINLRFRN